MIALLRDLKMTANLGNLGSIALPLFPDFRPDFGDVPAMREPIVDRLSDHDFVLVIGSPALIDPVEGQAPHLRTGAPEPVDRRPRHRGLDADRHVGHSQHSPPCARPIGIKTYKYVSTNNIPNNNNSRVRSSRTWNCDC